MEGVDGASDAGGIVLVGAEGAGPCLGLGAKTSTITAPAMPVARAPTKIGLIWLNVSVNHMLVKVLTTGAKPKQAALQTRAYHRY